MIGARLSSASLSFVAIIGSRPLGDVTKTCCIKRASIKIDNNKYNMFAVPGFWIV